MEQTLFDQVLPYAGTSGHSGSDTSRERAERNDRDGTTMRHQGDVMTVLRARGADGMNWREVGDRLNCITVQRRACSAICTRPVIWHG